MLRVHEALRCWRRLTRDRRRIVELRYFGGLSDAEIADALEISERTVRRGWDKARLMLVAALQ